MAEAVPALRAGRLTIAEKAAMELLGGIREKGKPASLLPQPGDGAAVAPGEKILLAALETGSEAEALEALRGLAALGGELNRRRLAAIMKDNAWPDALRTEAARALIEQGNTAEVRLAVRALGLIGGEANTDTLTAMIKDAGLPESLRLEAALGLGNIATPRAGDSLIEAFRMFSEPEVHEQLLGALGHFPFHQIEPTWKEFLEDPNTPAELRVAAVDALSNSSFEALAFLKTMAESDRDPEVREMSAWAIAAHNQTGSMGQELARMAKAEPEADVRRRLYEALTMQSDNPGESLLPVIQSETDVAARVAGFNALGEAIRRGASDGVTAEFNAKIVPELKAIAVSTESLNIRMRAVFAVRRADTPAARQALEVLSQTSNPKIALAALHGLQSAK
ncbi:MAG: HEAT repeat domain-containing protein [Verrucomicrobiota bacterium]